MAFAELKYIEIERFKSYDKTCRLELAPLTIIVGRNNSGKSTWIQALLLLKQTLQQPRQEVALQLEGLVEALSLRELTHGWPDELKPRSGPCIEIGWKSRVDIKRAQEEGKFPDLATLRENAGVNLDGLLGFDADVQLRLQFGERDGVVVLEAAALYAQHSEVCPRGLGLAIERSVEGHYAAHVQANDAELVPAPKLDVELEHFLPFFTINRRNVGPRDRHRSWHNAYLALFAQPLEDLQEVLRRASYLGAGRSLPSAIFKAATTPLEDVGASGELAAQMLHRHQGDFVHYIPPIALDRNELTTPPELQRARFGDAVNDVLARLSVEVKVSTNTVGNVGFQLLFGNASIQHVGRGLSFVLPVVEAGLVADPLAFQRVKNTSSLDNYQQQCARYTHLFMEEPESHLHPKVQSRLAHWFVSLARAGRRLIVETHSDHLVRRLRGLAARAPADSEMERWLRENVHIVQVDQSPDGVSSIETSKLTAEGGIAEAWPADFMEEATDEERAIYEASLDKTETGVSDGSAPVYEHDVGEEPEVDEHRG